MKICVFLFYILSFENFFTSCTFETYFRVFILHLEITWVKWSHHRLWECTLPAWSEVIIKVIIILSLWSCVFVCWGPCHLTPSLSYWFLVCFLSWSQRALLCLLQLNTLRTPFGKMSRLSKLVITVSKAQTADDRKETYNALVNRTPVLHFIHPSLLILFSVLWCAFSSRIWSWSYVMHWTCELFT